MAQQTSTSTQIRNMYSDSAYLNIKFYNTNLSFNFSPLMNKDANGRNNYNTSKSLQTTVNFDGAYALYEMSNKLINDTGLVGSVAIPCNGATLTLERRVELGPTFFSIQKNNETISFQFAQHIIQTKNGQQTIESGLGAFAKTVDGYLTGINADRHLDKLTEDYAKLKSGENNPQGSSNQGQGGYQKNRNYNGGYQKGNNYRRNNWNGNGNQQSWETKQPNHQNMSSYQIQN